MTEPRPSIDELVVGDEPATWTAAGFTVDGDTCRIGTVRVRLAGRGAGSGITAWSLRNLVAAGDIDGIPTTSSDRAPATPDQHACGARLVDHVVLMSPDGERTAAAVTAATGLEVRRVRDTDSYGMPMRQRFFRLGEVLLELVSSEPPAPGPVAFFGLAVTVDDLDALPGLLGEHVGAVKDAVQPGRRLAALRHGDLDISVPMIFMSPEP